MSREFRPGYLASFAFTKKLTSIMEELGVRKIDLAIKAGVSKPAVTQWFAPGRNLTIFTAAMIADHLGYKLEIHLKRKKESP